MAHLPELVPVLEAVRRLLRKLAMDRPRPEVADDSDSDSWDEEEATLYDTSEDGGSEGDSD